MNKKLRVVIIGAGKAAHRHAIAASRVSEIDLIGCYDVSEKSANSFAEQFGIRTYSDLASTLNSHTVDLAIICTPPAQHGEIAIQALEAGLHVLVEKPFDVDLGMIEMVERTAQQRGLIAAAVAQHRFAYGAKEIYQQLPLSGTPISASIQVQRHRPAEYFQINNDNWRLEQTLSGGGVLLTIGFHYLDLACWLLGEPKIIQATIDEQYQDIELAIRGEFQLGQTTCTVDAKWGEVITLPDSLKIVTTETTFELVGDQLINSKIVDSADRYDLHVRQFQDLVDSIRTGTRPVVTSRDVMPALRLINDLYNSAHQQKEPKLCTMIGK